MDFSNIKIKIEKICAEKGIKDYQISFSSSEDATCSMIGHEVASSTANTDMSFTLSIIINGKRGVYVSNVFDEDSLEDIVDKAKENTQYIDNDEEFEIFGGSSIYKELIDDDSPLVKVDKVIAKAKELQENILAEDKRVQESSQCETIAVKSEYKIANSKGLYLEKILRYEGAFSEAIVKDEKEAAVAIDFEVAPLKDIKKLNAVSKAIKRLGATNLQSGNYDVIFDSSCMRQILETFSPIFKGKNVYLGLSLLKAKSGVKIASDAVTIFDDPFEENSPVKINFDTDGVATYRKALITKGIQKNLVYNLSSAKKAGVQSTGNASGSGTGFFSLYFEKGKYSKEELIMKINNGLYISEMKGFHAGADDQTGDFSIDSEGFMIENGKLGKPVKGFTVSGNFYQLIKQIEAFSDDLQFSFPSGLTRIGSSEALIRQMSVAGK